MEKKERKGIILVGDGEELKGFYATMSHQDRVLGVFCDAGVPVVTGLTRLGSVSDATTYMDSQETLRAVYCSTSRIAPSALEAVQRRCKVRAVSFQAVVPAVGGLNVRWNPSRVGDSYLLSPRREALSRFHNRLLKRLFDFLLVTIFLLTLFPLVYLCKLVAIKRRERKPSVVFADCKGPDGRIFRRASFRGEEGSLAQVLNVFAGQMSLVGPPCDVVGQADAAPTSPLRVERRGVKAGMTGWAQLVAADEAQRLEADIWYLDHWSVWLDLKIIFKTLFKA